eukprot:3990409-Pyramimonas_sp.AAC.1
MSSEGGMSGISWSLGVAMSIVVRRFIPKCNSSFLCTSAVPSGVRLSEVEHAESLVCDGHSL